MSDGSRLRRLRVEPLPRTLAHRPARAVIAALALVVVAAAPAQAQAPRGSLVRIPLRADDGTLTPYTFTTAIRS